MRALKIEKETECTEHAKRYAGSWQQSIRDITADAGYLVPGRDSGPR